MLRIAAGAALLTLAGAALAHEAVPERPVKAKALADRCGTGAGVAAYRARRGLRAQPLGSMPPAYEIRAVYRSVDGCPTPVVLREGIGANKDQAVPLPRTMPHRQPLDR